MFRWRSGPLGFLVSRQILLADFERIVRKTRITTASVTHHANEAFALADTDQGFEASRSRIPALPRSILRPKTESVDLLSQDRLRTNSAINRIYALVLSKRTRRLLRKSQFKTVASVGECQALEVTVD